MCKINEEAPMGSIEKSYHIHMLDVVLCWSSWSDMCAILLPYASWFELSCKHWLLNTSRQVAGALVELNS